jgi:hypothetical protein
LAGTNKKRSVDMSCTPARRLKFPDIAFLDWLPLLCRPY